MCNDARLESEKGEQPRAVGDPTESALIVAAAQAGLREPAMQFPRVAEWPFDSRRKRMTTVHRLPASEPAVAGVIGSACPLLSFNKPFAAFSKGAVESLLALCERWLQIERAVPLTEGARRDIAAASGGWPRAAIACSASPIEDWVPCPSEQNWNAGSFSSA